MNSFPPEIFSIVKETLTCSLSAQFQIQPTDKISILGLAKLAPGKPIDAEIKHADGKVEKIKLNHTLNEQQIGWFKAGSALNRMKEIAAGK